MPFPTSRSTRIALAFAALLGSAAEVQGQAEGVVTLDEGRFLITMQGRQVGSEEFYIRRTGSGDGVRVIAAATIQWEDAAGRTDLAPLLEAVGESMEISNYQVKVSGVSQETVLLRPDPASPNRFQSSTSSSRGEQDREFRAAPRTLLLDTGVAHQHYFLAARLPSGAGTVPVITPRGGRQFDLRVVEVGSETISIGGVSLQSRHLRLEGNQETREVWLDARGRVLRVEIPGGAYLAVRESPP